MRQTIQLGRVNLLLIWRRSHGEMTEVAAKATNCLGQENLEVVGSNPGAGENIYHQIAFKSR